MLELEEFVGGDLNVVGALNLLEEICMLEL